MMSLLSLIRTGNSASSRGSSSIGMTHSPVVEDYRRMCTWPKRGSLWKSQTRHVEPKQEALALDTRNATPRDDEVLFSSSLPLPPRTRWSLCLLLILFLFVKDLKNIVHSASKPLSQSIYFKNNGSFINITTDATSSPEKTVRIPVCFLTGRRRSQYAASV